MRITINRADGIVGVDGVFRVVDLSALDAAINVIQFDAVKGRGHVEFTAEATRECLVRDADAEAAAYQAAGDDHEKLAALVPIYKTVAVRRENEVLESFDAYSPWLDAWQAAAPAAPSFAEQLDGAHRAIDAKAEEVRLRYITPGAGQAATYLVKERQAEEFRAAGYAGAVPAMVQAEVSATGASAQAACDLILGQRDAWIAKAAQIEEVRRRRKVALDALAAGDSAALELELGQAIAELGAL